jgi:hypothetical protein
MARIEVPSKKHGQGAAVRARVLGPKELTAIDVQAWAALEARALEPNAYASPYFVLPALRHLDPQLRAQIVLIERTSFGSSDVIGVAVVSHQVGTRTLPVPHLEFYQSRHSYLGSPLIDQGHAAEAAACLMNWVHERRWVSAGLIWPRLASDGRLRQVLSDASTSRGMHWHEAGSHERAVLIPAQAGPEPLKRAMGKGNKEIERCWRRLAETGNLQWTLHRGDADAKVIESFLRLEHSGWKAETQTSLRSHRADELFFQEMITGFASDGRALFTELSVDGEAVASTSNLISGSEGFAFKVGWDQNYRKFGVGILNEAEFVRQAPVKCADLQRFDSGSQPDSFIERMWPARRALVTAFSASNFIGDAIWRIRQRLGADAQSAEERVSNSTEDIQANHQQT